MDVADLDRLIQRAKSGEPRAVARLLSLVESEGPGLRQVATALAPYVGTAGNATVIGLTGAPGVGKSTLVAVLVGAYRAAQRRVGVLAVDPTSPFTGGALLGDRVRMQDHATDQGVFIRSMATRGHLGGLSAAVPQALRVLAAAGCDVVLVETVGVGQSEVEIAGLADTTLVLLAPDTGDAVQIAKAGVLEVGDIYVVNKADRAGADRVGRDLRQMLSLAGPSDWKPPIVKTVATDTIEATDATRDTSDAGDTQSGHAELLDAIAEHQRYLLASGELTRRRRARIRREIEALALAGLRSRIGVLPGDNRIEELVDAVLSGDMDPYAAADNVITNVGSLARFATTPNGKS